MDGRTDGWQLGTGPHVDPVAPRPFRPAFVPHVRSWEPHDFTEVTNGPQAYSLNILRLQK